MSLVLNAQHLQYVGQTSSSLDRHLWEHCWALKNGDLVSSVLAEHVFTSWWSTLTATAMQMCCMLGSPDTSSTNWPHSTGTEVLCQDSILYYWSDLTTFWRSIIIVLSQLLILSPPPPFHFLFLLCFLVIIFVTVLIKLTSFLTFCTWSLMWPYHRLTALLHLYIRACKCWLLTDKGSHSIPTLVPHSITSISS